MQQTLVCTSSMRPTSRLSSNEFLRGKAMAEREAKLQDGRDKRRRDFMAAIGTDLHKLDAASQAENNAQEAELASLLGQSRPKLVNRTAGLPETDTAALRKGFGETGHTILEAASTALFLPQKALLNELYDPLWTPGAIDSGWVLPEDPSDIHIKDTRHYPNALCWDNRQDPYPEFSILFTFVPATTATYQLTAVVAFNGFYILRSDDSWWNCRYASVKLTVDMRVHQYGDMPWQETVLLDVGASNADETISYDLTKFFDYSAALRGGDPVVVTVKGTVEASAHGAGAYAELNFSDGNANHIRPLFLSVSH